MEMKQLVGCDNFVHKGDFVVFGGTSYELGGILDGSILVKDGARLVVRGIFHGRLIVEPSGTADIHGVAKLSDSRCEGLVSVYGILDGAVTVRHLDAKPGSIIDGVRQ